MPTDPTPNMVAGKTAAEVFAEVRAMDFRHVEFDTLKSLIGNAFIGMRTRAPMCDAGLIVYRGVGSDDKGKPNKRARVSYPPIKCATVWGRVTRPGQHVFYCSVARDAIPFELGLRADDYVAIGRWRSTAQLMFTQVGFNRGVLTTLGGVRAAPTWTDNSVDSLSELDLQIDEFFSEQFCKIVPRGDDYLYKVSVAIAEPLFRNAFTFGNVPGYTGLPRVAGLVFPSIAMLGSADNLALLPTVADDSFCLDFIEWSYVEASGPDVCRLKPIDCANTFGPDGEIEWNGRPPQYTIPPGGKYTMRGSEIIEAFDAAGGRIEAS